MTGTLIGFDWDNTLFPTKARQLILSRAGQSKFPTKSELKELCALSHWVHRVLSAYISYYSAQRICIVTAAKRGWIEASLRSLSGVGVWAQIREMLFNKDATQRIEIVYPRSALLPFVAKKEVLRYKREAMHSLCRSRMGIGSCERIRMLVSIGDSSAEYSASKLCAESFEGMCVGRVKLQRYPTLRCLIRQCQCMLDLCANLQPENFDIDMS